MKNWEAPSSVPMSDVPTARSENVSSTVWLHLQTKQAYFSCRERESGRGGSRGAESEMREGGAAAGSASETLVCVYI